MPSLKIHIPAIGPSANEFFGRIHPMKRKKIVDAWHHLVAETIKRNGISPYAGGFPAVVSCTCYVPPGKRRMDSDNVYATEKIVTDAMARCGIIPGDSPRYIAQTILRSEYNADNAYMTVWEISEEADEAAQTMVG